LSDIAGQNVLIVFAHPDDESYGPGATLAGLAARGARLTLLTFTRGEHSTLGADQVSGPEELATIREDELRRAATELGIARVLQHRLPDGGLAELPRTRLMELATAALDTLRPALVVTFGQGGISGHTDHITASQVAVAATAEYAARKHIAPPPVYGWAMPARIAEMLTARLGRSYAITPDERIVEIPVAPEWLAAQWRAVQHHRTQHSPPPWPMEVRLEVQAGCEYLERLLPEGPLESEPLLEWLALSH
jgi:N-acetylglucosamine malate deacetylase 2